MQALVNRWLVPTQQVDTRIPKQWENPYFPGEPMLSNVGMNCWSTAFEVLRDWGRPWQQTLGKIAYFGPAVAEDVLFNNAAAIVSNTPLPRAAWTSNKIKERNAGRNPGDLLYITTTYSPVGPAHVAIWVDDDLYFEKTNYSAEDPIRLSFFNDVVTDWLAQDDAERPVKMNFIRYRPGALPNPEVFAGKDPFAGEQGRGGSPLPGELQKTMIFTLDMGLGGSLKEYSANRILSFPLGRDPKTGRAVYEGAQKLENFFISDTLCSNTMPGSDTFNYKVTTGMQLYVFNKQGREIARINGKKTGKKEPKAVLAEFRSGDKVLTVTRGEYGGLVLNHPGVTSAENPISLSCARFDNSFDL